MKSGRIIPAMYSGACALFHFRRVVFFKYLVRMACCGLVSSLRPEGGLGKLRPRGRDIHFGRFFILAVSVLFYVQCFTS